MLFPTSVRIHKMCWVAIFLLQLALSSPGRSILTTSSDRIRTQLAVVKKELHQLPQAHPCIAQSLGYSSDYLSSRKEALPIEIRFPEAAPIDLIVLMPTLFKGAEYELTPFGFPERFFIERILPDGTSEIVVDYREKSYPIQGIGPQLFLCSTIKPAIGLRITSTLSPARKRITLAEVFAFAGEWNAALNADVRVSSRIAQLNTWGPRYLVDGITPFLPICWHGDFIRSRVSLDPTDPVSLRFDLGEACEFDEFRIWPVMWFTRNNSPFSSGKGFPRQITLQRLESPEDLNPTVLLSSEEKPPRPGSNPMIKRVPPVSGRYFELTLNEGFYGDWGSFNKSILLSEIEFLSHGTPIPDITITQIHGDTPPQNLERLNDGFSSEGKILSLRPWIEQLSQRQILQHRQSRLNKKLVQETQREKWIEEALFAAFTILIILLSLMIWIIRLLAIRRNAQMREQIAADLHDELGANLSGIAHSAEMAKELIPSRSSAVTGLLDDAIEAARQTARETRQFVRLLEDRENGKELDLHIQKIAAQILGNRSYTCTLEESLHFNRLNPIRKWDLLFFVKETLNNIIKHAQASHVEILTKKDNTTLQLIISDDGIGIPPDRLPLHHLESRCKRLQGTLKIETAPNRGTQICLTLNRWKNR